MKIQNKVILITGAASGIGLETAIELLKSEAKGVIIVDLNAEQGKIQETKLKQQFGDNRVIFHKADITSKTEFEDAFKKAIDEYNHIDIVINNAGVFNDVNYLFTIDVNLGGTTTGTFLGIKYMDKNRNGTGGLIINVASIAAMCKNHRYTSPIYSATKAGIVSLSQGLGHQFHVDKTGVKIIAVCPGGTITPFHKNIQFLNGCREECTRLYIGKTIQNPGSVARSIKHVIENGSSGSVWLSDEENLYLVNDYDVLENSKKLVISNI